MEYCIVINLYVYLINYNNIMLANTFQVPNSAIIDKTTLALAYIIALYGVDCA